VKTGWNSSDRSVVTRLYYNIIIVVFHNDIDVRKCVRRSDRETKVVRLAAVSADELWAVFTTYGNLNAVQNLLIWRRREDKQQNPSYGVHDKIVHGLNLWTDSCDYVLLTNENIVLRRHTMWNKSRQWSIFFFYKSLVGIENRKRFVALKCVSIVPKENE